MARKRPINLPAPYLRRIWLDAARVPDKVEPVALADTDHYRLMREFFADPGSFVAERIGE